jgi:hypothetical protein
MEPSTHQSQIGVPVPMANVTDTPQGLPALPLPMPTGTYPNPKPQDANKDGKK